MSVMYDACNVSTGSPNNENSFGVKRSSAEASVKKLARIVRLLRRSTRNRPPTDRAAVPCWVRNASASDTCGLARGVAHGWLLARCEVSPIIVGAARDRFDIADLIG